MYQLRNASFIIPDFQFQFIFPRSRCIDWLDDNAADRPHAGARHPAAFVAQFTIVEFAPGVIHAEDDVAGLWISKAVFKLIIDAGAIRIVISSLDFVNLEELVDFSMLCQSRNGYGENE